MALYVRIITTSGRTRRIIKRNIVNASLYEKLDQDSRHLKYP